MNNVDKNKEFAMELVNIYNKAYNSLELISFLAMFFDKEHKTQVDSIIATGTTTMLDKICGELMEITDALENIESVLGINLTEKDCKE